MRLFIVRHGEAASAVEGERPLTENGRGQARAVADLLTRESLEHVLFSPKLRTRQTAAAILESCTAASGQEEPALLPPATPADVVRAIEACGAERVALVSHLPWVAELVGWFTSGDTRDYRLPGFPPSGVVALRMEAVGQGQAILEWHAFPPEHEPKI
ncbi:MAG: phosphohistidine phosphatase SixA [Halieaceae bacterium]